MVVSKLTSKLESLRVRRLRCRAHRVQDRRRARVTGASGEHGVEEEVEVEVVDVDRGGRRREEGAAVRCSWSPPRHGAERTAGVLARVLKTYSKSFGLRFIFVRIAWRARPDQSL